MGHEKENLSGYLDGAIADSERGRIEAHLKDCAQCRAELEALRAVSGMVKGLPQKPLPAGFLQRLENRRRQEARAEGEASLWAPRSVAWAACAVTVIFVTYKTAHLYAPMPIPSAADLQGGSSTAAPPAPAVRKSVPPAPAWRKEFRPPGTSGTSATAGAELPIPQAPTALAGPVSTADLVSMAKAQKRAEGIAALRGAAGLSGGSAASLAAPSAPKGFGGMAIGEAPEAKSAYTNEALQKQLEAERARMGIQRIVTPNPVVRSLRAAARGLAPAAAQSFDNASVPAPVSGQTSMLLAQPQGAGRGATEGALVPPEDFSGGASGSGLRARHKKDLGEPLPAAEEAGRAVYSMEETTLLWREQGLAGSAPRVDFSKEMLVVVFGQSRIESVTTAANRIVVSYRPLDSAPLPQQRWRVIPRSDLPVVFQPLP